MPHAPSPAPVQKPTLTPASNAPKRPRRVVVPQPNLRLDPQGLSGTQTARRVHNARRRRQMQTVWLTALASVTVVGAATFLGMRLLGLAPTFAGLPTKKIADLPFGAMGRATLDSTGALWVQSSDAALWKIGKNGASRKIYSATFPARPAPLLIQNHVVLATQDGQVSVLNATTGKKKWSREMNAPVSAQPLLVSLSGGKSALLCGGDDGRIAALDFRSGALLWSRDLGAPIGEGFKLAGSRVLIPTLAGQNARGGLVALDARTGASAWRFPAQLNAYGAGICEPFFDAKTNRVFWANDEGAVVCLTAQTGKKLWKTFAVPLEGKKAGEKVQPIVLRGCPTLLDGALVVGGDDGVLRAFDAKSGTPLWATPLGAPLKGRVQATSDLSILARTANGEAFVVGLTSGEVMRRTPFSASGVWSGKTGFDFTSNGELLRVG